MPRILIKVAVIWRRCKTQNVGYLGVDWQADGEYYKIKKIIRGAAWDAEVRSPLDMSGVEY